MLSLLHSKARSVTLRLALAALPAMTHLIAAHAHQIRTDTLRISHPYTIEPPEAGTSAATVYMVIHNTSTAADRLIGARSTIAKSVSLETKAGPETAGIVLPAEAETTIGPNATFVVMHDLTESLVGYAYIPMTLQFEHAGAVEIEVYVEAADEQPGNQSKP